MVRAMAQRESGNEEDTPAAFASQDVGQLLQLYLPAPLIAPATPMIPRSLSPN